jgi:hypothetical protein
MKKIFLALAIFASTNLAFAQAKANDIAKIEMETVDLGKIPQNIPAPAVFTVRNIGKTDLLIESAQPTCGCTIGDYTKTPIAPGKTGTITATFNAAQLGMIDKHMNVKFVGADDYKSIAFKGEVLTTEEYAKLKGTKVKPAAPVAVPVAAPVMASKQKAKAVGKKIKKG